MCMFMYIYIYMCMSTHRCVCVRYIYTCILGIPGTNYVPKRCGAHSVRVAHPHQSAPHQRDDSYR